MFGSSLLVAPKVKVPEMTQEEMEGNVEIKIDEKIKEMKGV
jgi:hypothetical protein